MLVHPGREIEIMLTTGHDYPNPYTDVGGPRVYICHEG